VRFFLIIWCILQEPIYIDLSNLPDESDEPLTVPPPRPSGEPSVEVPAWLTGREDEVWHMLRTFHLMTLTYGHHVPADLEDLWHRIQQDKLSQFSIYEHAPILAFVLAGLKYGPVRSLLESRARSQLQAGRSFEWQDLYWILADVASKLPALATDHSFKLWTHHYASRGSGPVPFLSAIGLIASLKRTASASPRASGPNAASSHLSMGASGTVWILQSQAQAQHAMVELMGLGRAVAGVLTRETATCRDWQASVRHLAMAISKKKRGDYGVLWLARALHDEQPLTLFAAPAVADLPGRHGVALMASQQISSFAETVPDEKEWLPRVAARLKVDWA
jgi:hypothetical protein